MLSIGGEIVASFTPSCAIVLAVIRVGQLHAKMCDIAGSNQGWLSVLFFSSIISFFVTVGYREMRIIVNQTIQMICHQNLL